MSSPQSFYFLLQETTNNSKYSWRREYLKLTLGGKRDKLEKVVEYEDKTIYRPTGLAFGLPYQVRRSTKLEYTQALLRFRADAAERKRVAELEKAARKLADKKLNGIRGLGPAPAEPVLTLATTPEPAAGLFDDFTIIDTEYQHEVLLEVAAIRYKNWQPVEEYVSFVRYTGWVSPFTTTHTGITEAHVRRAPTEKSVLEALAKLAGDSLLIAHNIGADRSKLKLASERQSMEELPNNWFCTMALARARLPKGVKSGLTDLCDRFKFDNEGAHRALSDVRRTFRVLRHFYQESPITSLDPRARKAATTLFAA
jgi:DNA polymerase III epsilon subunit-like protein